MFLPQNKFMVKNNALNTSVRIKPFCIVVLTLVVLFSPSARAVRIDTPVLIAIKNVKYKLEINVLRPTADIAIEPNTETK